MSVSVGHGYCLSSLSVRESEGRLYISYGVGLEICWDLLDPVRRPAESFVDFPGSIRDGDWDSVRFTHVTVIDGTQEPT